MKYYLGLDIGTNSVGWAVTDEKFKVVKKKGKSLWGVRLFDEAQSKLERRTFRSARRRLQRRKERITLLQGIFEDEINKIDPTFFIRLNESSLLESDRKLFGKYSLFNDIGKTDKDFYDKYKTIYHLREHLLESKEKEDIREIYLAFHHMIKYRGNFLQEGKEISSEGVTKNDLKLMFDELNKYINLCFADEESSSLLNDYNLEINDDSVDKAYNVFLSKRGRKNIFEGLCNLFNKKNNNLILKLLVGYQVKPGNLFNVDSYDEFDKIEFSSLSYMENVYPRIVSDYQDEEAQIIECAKNIFDSITVIQLLNGKGSISKAMVEKYAVHKEQLKEFKKYIKQNYSQEEYCAMFRPNSKNIKDKDKSTINNCSYDQYVGTSFKHNKKFYIKHCSREDFYGNVKKLLANKTDVDAIKILKLIEEDSFLPLLNSTNNSVLPYQLNENEMKQIISNQKEYYSFFNQIDKDGYNTTEKILSLLTFKIPYYIGPLNLHVPKNKKTYGWLVKKEEGKIYPWNFFSKVDQAKSAENFINKMKNTCSYLFGETTLAKNSILYSEYMVLSEVNKLKINGNSLNLEEKIDIIENLFKVKKKVTLKSIEKYISAKTGISDVKVTNSKSDNGNEIQASMSSYIDFKNIFKEDFDKYLPILDNIILDITLFEDKKILEKRLKEEYKIADQFIKQIKGLTYSGYGKLSNKLLNGITSKYIYKETGEVLDLTIIEIMRLENDNLMEVIYKYGFDKIINEENGNILITPEQLLEDSYLSPLMKRGVNQSLKIIKEIQEEILGTKIDKFFIECTRESSNDKTKKDSRREMILKLYKDSEKEVNIQLKKYIENNKKLLQKKTIENVEYISNASLRKEKIFLYFMQLGHCAYSGEEISFEDLMNDNNTYCDIDHIIPQSILKDDSIQNKVLVLKTKNISKRNTYPFDESILTTKGKIFLSNLHKIGLLSKEKYSRIVRKDELSDDEIFSFVNRQLTSTNQSVSVVCNILKQTYCKDDPTKVIYSKAANVSDFRNKFGLYKSRLVNDVHHAQDAYLNVVVGECFNEKYGFNGANIKRIYAQKKNGQKCTLNTKKLFENNILNSSGEIIWNCNSKEATIRDIKSQMYHKDVLFTTFKREQVGGLFKATIYSPKDTSKKYLIPIKQRILKDGIKVDAPQKDFTKYGGFSSPTIDYFALVESLDKKGERKYSIEPIAKLYSSNLKDNKALIDYLTFELKLKEPKIIINKLLVNTLIEIGNSRLCITGKTGDRYLCKNVNQLYFNQRFTNYVKIIEKLVDNMAKSKITDINKVIENESDFFIVSGMSRGLKTNLILTKKKNLELFNFLINKMSNLSMYKDICISTFGNKLLEKKEDFINLKLSEQITLLREILNMTKCDRVTSNFILMGGSKNSGVLQINKVLKENTRIIFQSTTGFFEKVIWEY